MHRLLVVLTAALTTACAEGDVNDETKSDATQQDAPQGDGPHGDGPQALVACTSGRLPQNGERCDSTEIPADAYCRPAACSTRCEDECFCRSNGRWECRLFCRDNFGCGSPPLCGVGCADAASD